MKVETGKLEGPALDWAVAMCEGDGVEYGARGYSTDWSVGGPIIEREQIDLFPSDPVSPKAVITPNISEPHFTYRYYGSTILIAAMRCYVASKMGGEIEIPEVLI